MSEQFNITLVDMLGLPARLVAVCKLWKEVEEKLSKPENVIPLDRVLRPEAIAKISNCALNAILYFHPLPTQNEKTNK